jgi:hypothetical protein
MVQNVRQANLSQALAEGDRITARSQLQYGGFAIGLHTTSQYFGAIRRSIKRMRKY